MKGREEGEVLDSLKCRRLKGRSHDLTAVCLETNPVLHIKAALIDALTALLSEFLSQACIHVQNFHFFFTHCPCTRIEISMPWQLY